MLSVVGFTEFRASGMRLALLEEGMNKRAQYYQDQAETEEESQFKHEYKYYQIQGELYAELGVLDYNLSNGIEHPFETKNEVLSNELITDFLALLGDIFSSLESPKKIMHLNSNKKMA
ncbi:hypothetical protein [Candidatus Pristimantibacillus sp. PTI5]|uniref:hypothetical protein n=1 Tax=Candidatus Pristimantibacillus sp. PTI5 TaxID=3400422 RepID=UPI003B02A254